MINSCHEYTNGVTYLIVAVLDLGKVRKPTVD